MTQLERQELISRIGAMSREEKEFIAELLDPSIMISEIDRVLKRYANIEEGVLCAYGVKRVGSRTKDLPKKTLWKDVFSDPPEMFESCVCFGILDDDKIKGDSGTILAGFFGSDGFWYSPCPKFPDKLKAKHICETDLRFKPIKWMSFDDFARETGLIIESDVIA